MNWIRSLIDRFKMRHQGVPVRLDFMPDGTPWLHCWYAPEDEEMRFIARWLSAWRRTDGLAEMDEDGAVVRELPEAMAQIQ